MSYLRRKASAAARVLLGFALIITLCAVVVVAVPQVIGADESYVVTSDSMSPEIEGGDVVIVTERPPERIEEDDVITFAPPGDDDRRTTHRVVEVQEEDSQLQFLTQGDANDAVDPAPVPADRVIGEVTLTIPYFGRFVAFAQTTIGIVSLIILPGLALVGTELWELKKGMDESETDDSDDSAEADTDDESDQSDDAETDDEEVDR
ncbi:signal peptidase I [Natranaeroarchaeum sulfidigenes]|uniref:Signal peptidase I n=1 Tax=Natranaeroarchaeum sulfidigenes TaxID=2784880 RepID=A0A897MTP8_9EURY|nr:signal peptidase I [Natranaeroarchaeum sulfidigenes]QSG03882.1 Signal peptidase I [Natranaeroarchaeum sulfidigenes]